LKGKEKEERKKWDETRSKGQNDAEKKAEGVK
jgi:hypothetical protein